MMAPKGDLRSAMVTALTSLWQFGPAPTLSPTTSLTFLGIDWSMKANGDIVLSQERFVQELLAKHDMTKCTPSRLSRSTSLLERLACRPQRC